MQFEYDPEKLIEEVKSRPGIWDFDDPDYRAKNVRQKLWKQVVGELMQADVKVTKCEWRELELQLQKKWKSIRDSFQKYIQNPNRTKRPYIYSKQMQFLLKNPINRNEASSDSDVSDVPAKRSKKDKWRYKKKFKLSKDDEQSSEEEDDTHDDSDDNNAKDDSNEEAKDDSNDDGVYIEVPQKVSRASRPEEFLFANVDALTKTENDDPDKLFLLSLLPHLKAIPEEGRLNAKLNLMQVLRNSCYTTNSNNQKIF